MEHGNSASLIYALNSIAEAISDSNDSGEWTNWSPSLTNITVGSGSLVARYKQIGNTVHFIFKFTYGSGSAMGTDPKFTLPVAIHADSVSSPAYGYILDSGSTRYPLIVLFGAASRADMYAINAAGTYASQAAISSSVPIATWATGDIMAVAGTYEAA